MMLFVPALSVSILAVAGCGGGGSSDSPQKVVDDFLAAATSGDGDAAYGLITEESKAGVAGKSEIVEGFSEGIESCCVGEGSISGDKAMVPVVFKLDGMVMGPTFGFNVVSLKEGDAWKVSEPDPEIEMEKALDKPGREHGDLRIGLIKQRWLQGRPARWDGLFRLHTIISGPGMPARLTGWGR